MFDFYRRLSFKKQLILLFAMLGFVAEIVIAVFIYNFEKHQVEKNATFIINNTTKQTATMFSNRLEIILNQYNKLKNSTGFWRFVNSNYEHYDNSQKYDDIIETYNKMKDIYSNNSEVVDSIYLQNFEGISVQVYNDMIYDTVSADLEGYPLDSYDDNYGYTWMNNHPDTIFQTNVPRNVISIAERIRNSKAAQTGVMVLNLKSKYFQNLLDNVEISKNAYAVLLSADGCMMSENVDNKYKLSDEEMKKLYSNADDGANYSFKGDNSKQNMVAYYSPLNVNNWYLVSIVPYNDLVSSSKQLAELMTGIIFVILICTVIFATLIATLITKPIEKLTKQVIAFENNPDVDFHVDSGYEIRTLGNGLSHMKQSVENLLEQVREEQDQKAKLKLLILQAQIQPHFLYNTLASINQLVNMNENDKASQMCEALSKFYRLGLSKGKDIISVREEIEHIQNYLLIQKFRYEKDFEYSINISENIMKMSILKLSLQPLVENAIYHGIKNREDKGTIVISGYQKEDCMILEVFDDGSGIAESELCKISEALKTNSSSNVENGFGIYNVNSRLKLFFGNEAELVYDSCIGVYTQAKIIIPLNKFVE